MPAFKSKMPAGGLVDANGAPNQQASAYLQDLEKQLANVKTLAGVDPITPGDTTAAVTSRVVTDGANSGTGVDTGSIGFTTTNFNQSLFNSFTTIMNVLNTFNTNQANLKTAVDAINTRVIALETKLDEIITALTPS